MTKKMKDPNEPVGRMFRVKDYLPPPEKLVLPEETVKVTISLKKSSVVFFKDQAGRYHTKYQKMIRELVDRYAKQYSYKPSVTNRPPSEVGNDTGMTGR